MPKVNEFADPEHATPPDLQCGTCKHWHRNPPNPTNLKEITGLCREGPPNVTVLPDGRGGTIVSWSYPPLPPNWGACSRHASRIALPVTAVSKTSIWG
jgi:hypothetical protein